MLAFAFIVNSVPSASAETDYYVKVLYEGVNFRSGPGVEYKLKGHSGGPLTLTYLGAQFDSVDILWYKIKDKSGFTGWVSSNYSRRYLKKSALPEIGEVEEYTSDGTAFSDVYEYIYGAAKEGNAIGVQVAAIRGSDGHIFDWTWGDSKYGIKKMGNATKIRAASISKTAIAICAVKMQEQGIIDLNKNIKNLWGTKLPKPVSMATLLTHTSTLRYLYIKPDKEGLLEQLIRKDGYTDDNPGSAASWYYNNFGSAVAAATLELAAGRTLEDYAQENLFGPLGLDMSFFSGNIQNQSRLATLYEEDHGVELTVSEAKYIVPDGDIGNNAGNYIGGLTGSARDIAKMYYMLANDGKFKGKQILAPESVELLEKKYFKATENGGTFRQCLAFRYGKDFYGTKGIYYHTGNAYGVIALASYDPLTKNVVVVMTTGASHARDENGVYKICSGITEQVYTNIEKF